MSKRNAKRHQHECQEQIYRRLLKRVDDLWKIKYKRIPIKPIPNGYYHTFAVRPDIARSSEGEIYQKILPMVNDGRWSRGKELNKDREDYGWFSFSYGLMLRTISHEKYSSLTDREKKIFSCSTMSRDLPDNQKRYHVKYPWKFCVVTQRSYITETLVYDSSIDSELSYLNKKLDRNPSLVFRLRGGNWDRRDDWWDHRWYNRRRIKKEKEEELRDAWELEN